MLGVTDRQWVEVIGLWLMLVIAMSFGAVMILWTVRRFTKDSCTTERCTTMLDNWTHPTGLRFCGKSVVCTIGVLVTTLPLLLLAAHLTGIEWIDLGVHTAGKIPTPLRRTSNETSSSPAWRVMDWDEILRVQTRGPINTTTTIPPSHHPTIPPTTLPTTDIINDTLYMETKSDSARPWLLTLVSLPALLLVFMIPGYVCWKGARLARGVPPLPPLPSPYHSSLTLRPDPISPNVVVNDNFIGGQWVLGSGLDYGEPPQHISQTSTTSTITTTNTGTPVYDEPQPSIYAQTTPVPGYTVPRVLQTIPEETLFTVELDE